MTGYDRETIKERLAGVQGRQRTAERFRKWALVLTAVAAAVGVSVTTTIMIVRERGKTSLDAVRTIAVAQRNHTTESVTYAQAPPVGGDHDPTWQNCGIYLQPLRNENVVHAQEHGAVWITYRPDLPADQLRKLGELTAGREYVIVSPYAGLRGSVVASAWGRQLTLDGVDDPRLTTFIRSHVKGRAAPEPGAPCTGGTGKPVV